MKNKSSSYKALKDQRIVFMFMFHLLSVTKEKDAERILHFVSSFSSSRLGSHLQSLSDGERLEFGLCYLHDFLLLSLKIKSKDELRVQTHPGDRV